MSENYLMLNGKRIDLTEEQVKTLTAEEKKSPFERVKKDDKYFRIEIDGEVIEDVEEEWKCDADCHSVANYCTDEEMMKQRALHEILNRLLWRYNEEHDGDNEPWNNMKVHFYIMRSIDYIGAAGSDYCKAQGVVYFKDKETAQSAIEEIVKPFMAEHPDFVW